MVPDAPSFVHRFDVVCLNLINKTMFSILVLLPFFKISWCKSNFSHFQCLNQKNELEKKLLGMSYQEGSSTESNVLVKHLQEELRKCVSWAFTLVCRLMFGKFSHLSAFMVLLMVQISIWRTHFPIVIQTLYPNRVDIASHPPFVTIFLLFFSHGCCTLLIVIFVHMESFFGRCSVLTLHLTGVWS